MPVTKPQLKWLVRQDRLRSGFKPFSSTYNLKLSGVIDPIYPTPPLGQGMTQGQFLTEFSFS